MQAGHNGEPRQAERHKKGQRQLRRQGCCCLSKNWEQRLDQPAPCMHHPDTLMPITVAIQWRVHCAAKTVLATKLALCLQIRRLTTRRLTF